MIMDRKKRLLQLVLPVCLFVAAGCGYTTRSMLAGKYRTVYIPPFFSSIDITREADAGNKYKLYRPGLETDITKTLTNKFLFDGNVRPADMGRADLELKGELVEFRRDALRYRENDEVDEYRINLVVNISLWDRKENKLLWEEKGFTGDTSYFPAQRSEDAAIRAALDDLARRIVARVVEEW
ncbi:MAG: LPS assembly lipoprotein LptE [Candidatus Omnitrophica bacterium]|nr:LPS assembly lipoprotein LptE [Candidatus Omnitrophota bacterium]